MVQVDGFMLHVTVYVRAEIGIAPDEHADSRCLTCRGAVKGTRVYLCSQCGAPIHCDREGDGDDCLLGSDCPGCRTPIRFDGYSYLPEGA